ncbi:MAG: methylenetetrahydrofolate reductase [Acidobacteriota bacterium]|nr:methylenetetrahydrofolate reductase [Acidobacteriota bacterium]MDW3228283.1 methylenetetrahydrofolate reductase [Acidobacteriota bacterium]MDY0230877.1 methylenetetrahydrofolate reductase [Candidatus Saccharicenans sp.]
MKVSEALTSRKRPVLSLEILPPNKGSDIEDLYRLIDPFLQFDPLFISVTFHQPQESLSVENGQKIKIRRQRRPGTVAISASLKHQFGVETVPHLICAGYNRYELEDALLELHYLGLENIFVIRGDPQPGEKEFRPEPGGHTHACELVKQIDNLNHGYYLEGVKPATATDFCSGVAGYPEKHPESPSLEFDLFHLEEKIEAGARFVITQMFFSVEIYQNYLKGLKQAEINVPVLPGFKLLYNQKQLAKIPATFGVSLPPAMVEAFEACRTAEEEKKTGLKFGLELAEKMLEVGAPGIHIFTMSQKDPVIDLLKILFKR